MAYVPFGLSGPEVKKAQAKETRGRDGGSIRNIVELPSGPDGLFKQPDWGAMSDKDIGNYNRDMQHRRMGASVADYADQVTNKTNTSDETGDYICGGCNKRDNRGKGKRCLLVR